MLNFEQKFWCEALDVVKLHYMNFIGPKIPGLLSRAISNHEQVITAGAQYLESQIVHFNLNSESKMKI